MLRRSHRNLLLVGFALLVIAGAGWAYWQSRLQGPLDGTTTHDFGTVLVDAEPARLNHTFRLVNRAGHRVSILAAKPDCGCVALNFRPVSVDPGQSIELPVSLTLEPGPKSARIRLDLGGDAWQTLRVQGYGRRRDRLTCSASQLSVTPQRPVATTITAYVFETFDAPSDPVLIVPEGVSATFNGWELNRRASDPRYTPSQWEGRVTITQHAPTLPAGAALTVQLEPAVPLTILLRPGA